MKEAGKIFNFPAKTFEPENLLAEMLEARDGDVFLLGETCIKSHEGEPKCRVVMARIIIGEETL